MSHQADFIEAMKALGHDSDAILDVVSKVEEIKLERKREKTRNRVKRYRDKQDVTQVTHQSVTNGENVTDVTPETVTSVTGTLSPLGPPLSPTPPNPPYNPPNPDQSQGAGDFKLEPPEQPKPKRTARTNGKRLSEDWQPTPKDLAFATKHGLTPEEIEDEANRFRNTWTTKPGKDGRKLDWGRTWENWITNPTLGPVARKKREAERAASRGYSTATQAKPRGGGLAAAGVGLVAEARGYR